MIAAAGTPGGFRAYEKLENIDGTAMVSRMIESFRLAGVEDIVVVTGYRARETEKSLAKQGVVFLRRDDYETAEMLDFVKEGLTYLKNNCDRIFFCPSDVPLFTEETLRRMEEENALPHGWENMPYEDFLVERRKLMAAKIKQAFEVLKNNAG